MNDEHREHKPYCLICVKPLPDWKPVYCCSGTAEMECGCGGMPIDPPICSQVCMDALLAGIGTSYEERRVEAGIPVWEE